MEALCFFETSVGVLLDYTVVTTRRIVLLMDHRRLYEYLGAELTASVV
jgi:hypothetical protein